jgi:hypothetical protein
MYYYVSPSNEGRHIVLICNWIIKIVLHVFKGYELHMYIGSKLTLTCHLYWLNLNIVQMYTLLWYFKLIIYWTFHIYPTYCFNTRLKSFSLATNLVYSWIFRIIVNTVYRSPWMLVACWFLFCLFGRRVMTKSNSSITLFKGQLLSAISC